MIKIPILVEGSFGLANYLGLVDTGSTYVILSERDCVNNGLSRDKQQRKISILTVKGETVADLYSASSISIVGTNFSAKMLRF